MSRQEEMVKKKTKTKGCRGVHHSIHSPNLELEYCKNCAGYVQIIKNHTCYCCKKPLAKFLKHTWLSRVLKFGVRQHHNFLRDWSMFPMDCVEVKNLEKPRTITQYFPEGSDMAKEYPTGKRIKIKEGFYRGHRSGMVWLEVKYRDTVYEIPAKYLALALEPINEDAKLDMIKKHVGIKGLRIWIPDSEQTDVKCMRCDSFLRMKGDKVLCPKCDK